MNEQPRQRSPERIKEVLTIFGGPHVVGESRNALDRYAKEARNAPLTHVHRIDERPMKNAWRKFEDFVFIEADVRWVYHPHVMVKLSYEENLIVFVKLTQI